MNRRLLEKHLRSCGRFLHHHGGRHDVWINPSNLARASVPRHNDVKRATARGICRILGIPEPRGL